MTQPLLGQPHDALPAIDKEYDHPLVKGLVHSLIAEEMKDHSPYFTSMEHDTTVPNEIDDFLSQRYPHLWNNQRIEQSLQKIEQSNKFVNESRLRDSAEYHQVTPPPVGNTQRDAKVTYYSSLSFTHNTHTHSHSLTQFFSFSRTFTCPFKIPFFSSFISFFLSFSQTH